MVIGVDRDSSLLGELKGVNITTICADVGSVDGRAQIKRAIGDAPVGMLVHLAALLPLKPLMQMELSEFRDVQRTIMEAPIFLTQALLPNIRAADGRCRIILTGGKPFQNYTALPWMGAYASNKCGMKMICKTLQIEMDGIASVALAIPGITNTPLMQAACECEGWPLAEAFKPRMPAYGGTDHHSPQQAAEWFVALLNDRMCDDATFVSSDHYIDDPSMQYGVTVGMTTEHKELRSLLEIKPTLLLGSRIDAADPEKEKEAGRY
jgi:NAD(P)-dependent dehydrogenase (short-subunit alcohol dehydrogenase family)